AYVGGRGERRVAAERHEQLDTARGHVVGERAQRNELVLGADGDGGDVRDGRAGVPERGVHLVCERLHLRRLRLAGEDEAPPAVRTQVRGGGVDPAARDLLRRRRRGARDTDGGRERARDERDVDGSHPDTV